MNVYPSIHTITITRPTNNPHMNKLQFPQAKLLYGVAQLSKQGQISTNERRQLKGTSA